MAVFSEKTPGSGGAREGVPGLSIIGAGMRVVGDISADGVVISREAIIGGEVRGAIYAEERVELQATSVVHGDVHTKKLLIQEGGEINGVLRMGEDAGQPPQVTRSGQALARA